MFDWTIFYVCSFKLQYYQTETGFFQYVSLFGIWLKSYKIPFVK